MSRATAVALILMLDVAGALQVKTENYKSEAKVDSTQAVAVDSTQGAAASATLVNDDFKSSEGYIPDSDIISEETELPNPSHNEAVEMAQETLLMDEQKRDEREEKGIQVEPSALVEMDKMNETTIKKVVDEFNGKDNTEGEATKEDYAFRRVHFGPKPEYSLLEIQPGTLAPVMSGDMVKFESEVVPGSCICRNAKHKDLGEPMKWHDLSHYFSEEMTLCPCNNAAAVHKMNKATGQPITSGQSFKWLHADCQLDLLLALKENNGGHTAYMWPHPLTCKPVNDVEPADFKIEHAKELDTKSLFEKPMTTGGWGWNYELKNDMRLGEPIKDGDSVFIRHPASTGDPDGDWFYLSGDCGEKEFTSKCVVGMPHHYPGYDGHVPHLHMKNWMNVNDAHATSSRFTVRRVSKTAL